MKGRLVRTILFPKPAHFKFYSDSMKFIAVLGLMGILGYGVTLPFQLRFELTAADLVDRSLDLITVTVPPALPAAMTIGSVFAINRLRKNHQIYCISPPRMNVAGKVNCLIFDKTGTLTEDGMDLHGV